MNRTRIMLSVFVDLDPIPGTFHTAESARDCVDRLVDGISHYKPIVSIESYGRKNVTYTFDGSNPYWTGGSHEYNMLFIKAVMSHMNDKLRVQGHLFLNEVYDAFGFPRTRDGAMMGWTEGPITWDHENKEDSIDVMFSVEGFILDKAFS